MPITSLAHYAGWVAEHWLYPVHTATAERHLRAKLREEVAELRVALAGHDPAAIIGECGDVAWCCTALHLNAFGLLVADFRSCSIGRELAHEPSLVELGQLAGHDLLAWDAPITGTRRGLTPPDISRLVLAGDMGIIGAVMAELAHQVSKASHMTRLAETAGYSGWFDLYRYRLRDGIAQMLALLGHIAQLRAGRTLADVVDLNHDKLAQRVAHGQPVTSPAARPPAS